MSEQTGKPELVTTSEKVTKVTEVVATQGEQVSKSKRKSSVCSISQTATSIALSDLINNPDQTGSETERQDKNKSTLETACSEIAKQSLKLKDSQDNPIFSGNDKNLLEAFGKIKVDGLTQSVQQKLTELGLSGLTINSTAGSGTEYQSSVANIAFLTYLNSLDVSSNLTPEQIITQGANFANKVISNLHYKGEVSFSVALIDEKTGLVTSYSGPDEEILLIHENGHVHSIKSAETPGKLGTNGFTVNTDNFSYEKTVSGTKLVVAQSGAEAKLRQQTNLQQQSLTEVGQTLATKSVEQYPQEPIQENIVFRKAIRLIPDVHGGVETVRTSADIDDLPPATPLEGFLKDLQEGELVVSAGDIFDRGAHSWVAAEQMMNMVQKGEAVWNLGNHELIFMAAMVGNEDNSKQSHEALSTWFLNGGMEMAEQAGVDISNIRNLLSSEATRLNSDKAALVSVLSQLKNNTGGLGEQVLQQLRTNVKLSTLNRFLIEQGKTYTIANNVLVTHAGIPVNPDGSPMNISIGGRDFGAGLDALDAIQKEIRNGNAEVIHWLGNHGGTNALNRDNPFWTRDEYQNAVKTEASARILRDKLNEQAKARGSAVELVAVGHTAFDKPQSFPTGRLGVNSPPRFVFFDTGAYKTGEEIIIKLLVPPDSPDKVTVIIKDQNKRDHKYFGPPGTQNTGHQYPLSQEVKWGKPGLSTSTASLTQTETSAEIKEEPNLTAAPANKEEEEDTSDSPSTPDPNLAAEIREGSLQRVVIFDDPNGTPTDARIYIKTKEHQDRLQKLNKAIMPDGKTIDPRVLAAVPRLDTDTNEDYYLKILMELENDIRHADQKRTDPNALYSVLRNQMGLSGVIPEHLLATVEAERRVRQFEQTENIRKERIEQLRARLQKPGTQIASTTEEMDGRRHAVLPYMDIFSEAEGVKNPEAEADITAFRLVSEALSGTSAKTALPDLEKSASFPGSDEYNIALNNLVKELQQGDSPLTFKELINGIRSKISQADTSEKRFMYKEMYARAREHYYREVETALQFVDNYDFDNEQTYNLQTVSDTTREMLHVLRNLNLNSPEGLKKAINTLNMQGTETNRVWQERMNKALTTHNNEDLFYLFALKGAEYYIRMVKPPVWLPERGNTIFIPQKKARQGVHTDFTPPETPISKTRPPVKPVSQPTSPDVAPPGGVIESEAEVPPQIDSAPEATPAKPGTPEPVSKEPEPTDQPDVDTAPTIPEELDTELVLASKSYKDRFVQNVYHLTEHLQAESRKKENHSWWYRAKDRVFERSYKVPIVGGVVKALVHPIEQVWQNGFWQDSFKGRQERFAIDMQMIIKAATADSAVPVKVDNELLDRALSEARKHKKKLNPVRRAVWALSDFSKGILIGVSQTSDQKLAKDWLRAQFGDKYDNKGNFSVDPNFVPDLQQKVLKEYNAEGEGFAKWDRGNLTLEQSNRMVLSQHAGETRHEANIEAQAAANAKIKELIKDYAEGTITSELELITQVNKFVQGDFVDNLGEAYQEEFKAPEVATNIVSLANKVKSKWNTQNGYSEKWDQVHITMLFGQGEWGGARGKVERDVFGLTDKILRKMAERSYLHEGRGDALIRGGLTLMQFTDRLKDAGVLATSFTAGVVTSVAIKAGMKAVGLAGTAVVGAGTAGLGGIAGVAAATGLRESGIDTSRFGSKLLTRLTKGGYQTRLQQTSREAAQGRVTRVDAVNRAEMLEKLVGRRNATDIIDSIKVYTSQETLTDQTATELLMLLAQTDARKRLSDLSNQRELNFKVQNFIEYTYGKENEQRAELGGLLENAMVRLIAYKTDHPTFLPGQELYTSNTIGYRKEQGKLGMFEKYSALAEAQLRFGPEKKKDIKAWLKNDLKLSDAEAEDWLSKHLGTVKLDQPQSSLVVKERLANKARRRSGIKTAAISALTAGAMSGGMAGITAVSSELSNLYGDYLHSGKDFSQGVTEWVNEWEQVLNGEPVVEFDTATGNWDVDLSPLQKGTLLTRSLIEPPAGFGHLETIDSVDVTLPPSLRYFDDGNGHDCLVDVRTGEIALDMSNIELKVDQFGQLDSVSAKALADHNIIHNAQLQQSVSETEIVSKQVGTENVTVPGTNIETVAPKGNGWHSVWQSDTEQTGTYELIAVDNSGNPIVDASGNDVVLLDEVKFSSEGKIISHDAHGSEAVYHHLESESIVNANMLGENGEWDQHAAPVEREWYSYNESGSQNNELQLYNARQGDGVVLNMSKMGEAWQKGVDPEHINVQDVIKDGQAGFAFTVPGHGTVVISDITDGLPPDGKLFLDPNDNVHTVTFPDGHTITLGEFSKMVINKDALDNHQPTDGWLATEYRGWQNVFNLGNEDGKMGTIEAVRIVDDNAPGEPIHIQSFATIRGSGTMEVVETTETSFTPVVSMNDVITEKVITTTTNITLSSPPIDWPDWLVIPAAVRPRLEKSYAPETLEAGTPLATGVLVTKKPRSRQTFRKLFTPKSQKRFEEATGQKVKKLNQSEFAKYSAEIEPAITAFIAAAKNKSKDTDAYLAARTALLEVLTRNEGLLGGKSATEVRDSLESSLSKKEEVSEKESAKAEKELVKILDTFFTKSSAEEIAARFNITKEAAEKLKKDKKERKSYIQLQLEALRYQARERSFALMTEAEKTRLVTKSAGLSNEELNVYMFYTPKIAEARRATEVYRKQQLAAGKTLTRQELDRLYNTKLKELVNHDIPEKDWGTYAQAQEKVDIAKTKTQTYQDELVETCANFAEWLEEEFEIVEKPNMGRYTVAEGKHEGRVRQYQQDYCETEEITIKLIDNTEAKEVLLTLGDGMGGHAAGDIASKLAVATAKRVYKQSREDGKTEVEALEEAVKAANNTVHTQAQADPGKAGMGTTLVFAILKKDGTYFVANVGDSRAYVQDDQGIHQITEDNSWVAEQVKDGLLTPEEAKQHPQRNVVTRAIGTKPTVEVDTYDGKLKPGQQLLLCSDGLSGMIEDSDIVRIMTEKNKTRQEVVEELIAKANENGGHDNISALVAKYTKPTETN